MILYTRVHHNYEMLKQRISTIWATKTIPLKGDIQIQEHLSVRGRIYIANYGTIRIGSHVTINSAGWANPIGSGVRTYFQVMEGAVLSIGSHAGLSNCAITCSSSVTIGDYVLLGSGVKIYDTDFHPIAAEYRYGSRKDNAQTRSKPIVIESGAFIGAGSYILKGVHIGMNSVIGAGSVVRENIPANEIWAGNPAVFLRHIEQNEVNI